MATVFETQILENLISLFGGNVFIFGLFGIGLLVTFLLLLKLPQSIVIPMAVFAITFFSIGTYAPLPEFNIVIGLLSGVIIAFLVAKIWGDR